MSEGSLLLGPILFEDFELPERVRWGGTQKLIVHRLPGGARVIDALGRDDDDIAWSGIFSGADAAPRARGLDLMRADGGFWPLTWDLFFYTVIVSRFEADYTRSNWIPYRVTCKVVRDEAAAPIEAAMSLATSIRNDLGTAQALDCAVPLDLAITSVGLARATKPGSAAYAEASAAVSRATQQIESTIALTQEQLGGMPVSSAEWLNAAADLAARLASLTAARGYVQRAGANLAEAAN